MDTLRQLEDLPYTFSPSLMRWEHHATLEYYLTKYAIQPEDVPKFLKGQMSSRMETIHPGKLLHVGGLWMLPCVRFGDAMPGGKQNEERSIKQSIEILQAAATQASQPQMAQPGLISEVQTSLATCFYHIGDSYQAQKHLKAAITSKPSDDTEMRILQLMSGLGSYCESEWLPLLEKYASGGGSDIVLQIWSSPKCQQIVMERCGGFQNMLQDKLSRTLLRSSVVSSDICASLRENTFRKVASFLSQQNTSNINQLIDEITTLAIQSAITGWIHTEDSDPHTDFVEAASKQSNTDCQITKVIITITECITSPLEGQLQDALLALPSEYQKNENIILLSNYFHFNQESEIRNHEDNVSTDTGIDDSLLEDFYNKNPYPVWQSVATVGLQRFQTCRDYLIKYLPKTLSASIPRSKQTEKILIAGCGSGHQIALALEQYRDSHVVGLDLSKVNLCYASKRLKSLKYPTERYELLHGDITNITRTDSYNVIECCGVLHHCKDPEKALQSLANSLCMGGVLFLGVYAMHSTEPIRSVIDYIHSKYKLHSGSYLSLNEVRAIRSDILSLPQSSKIRQALLNQQSFYSTPAFRDMLFHPRAAYYSISDLQALVQKVKSLQLLAFQFDTTKADISNRLSYSNVCPSDENMTDWNTWKKLEGKTAPQTLPWHHIILKRVS